MAQTTDVIINGAGYMLQPGTYKRLQDGFPEGNTQRTTQSDFFGGQRRALQLERDTFFGSVGVGPALGGQGVKPWTNTNISTAYAPITTMPSHETRVPHVIVRDYVYFAIDKRLYRGPLAKPGGSASVALLKEYGSTITDLTVNAFFGILIAFGDAADIMWWNTKTGTDTVFASGERAHYLQAYAGWTIWNDARTVSRPTIIRMATGTDVELRNVDHEPIGLTTIGGELTIITKQSIYTFNGRVKLVEEPNPAWNSSSPSTVPKTFNVHRWQGEFQPYYQQGVLAEQDDYTTLFVSYGGRTIAWIAGGVHEHVPSGDRAGWRSTGLSGKRCFGGTVAAGYVLVSIESLAGNNEIWAYNGTGWWCIESQPMPADGIGIWCWPFPTNDTGSGRHVAFFRSGDNRMAYIRLADSRRSSSYNYALPATGTFVSSMIDGGQRDKHKAWRRIGAVFASPELEGNTASTDPLNVYLDYSIDGGETWTEATYRWCPENTIANNNFELTAQLQAPTSTFIILRVRWASVSDWAPTLVGIWAEHETLNLPWRRRKWQFQVHARDQEIDRDGVTLNRTGRQLINDLWQAWETDTPLTFRDQDYDAAPVQRTVRIVGITEHVENTADSNNWGDSTITLQLVEV